jgi:glycosyltransferase involved in cell wall biosynthesis
VLNTKAEAGANRALLCAPGDVNEFVEATLALVDNPALSESLGANARIAAERYYTWDQHAADLWAVLSGTQRRGFHADLAAKGLGKAD